MPTANSMMDKICGAGQSKKAQKTLHLQRGRENKKAQEMSAPPNRVDIESNWRVAAKKEK